MNRTPVYRVLEVLTRTWAMNMFDYRAEGAENLPREGGVILASTHESHLDPMTIQAPLPRRIKYIARGTLFDNPAFGWFIRNLGAIAFDREGTTHGGLKLVIDELHRGEAVVYFPEGTRSRDGEIGRLRPGIALLARRAGVPVLPAGIDGTFGCWPRGKPIFKPGRIRIVFGEPVIYDAKAKRDEVLEDLERRLRVLKERARALV